MINQINKYNIKIPTNVSVIYSKKKRTLTFSGPLETKSITLKLKIFIDKTKKIISISPITFSKISNTEKKNIKTLRNTTAAQIKHILIESSILSYQKLIGDMQKAFPNFQATVQLRLQMLRWNCHKWLKEQNKIR